MDNDEEKTIDIAKETMTGDIRDCILTILRTQAKSWKELTEDEQRNLAGDVQEQVEHIVARSVHLIAADGRPVIEAKLDSIMVKDGFKATITMSKEHELRHQLIDSQGCAVLLVVSDSEPYKGEKAPANIDPSQRTLPVDDTGPVADNARATAVNG